MGEIQQIYKAKYFSLKGTLIKLCDQPISLEEIINSIHNLKNNTSPVFKSNTALCVKFYLIFILPIQRLLNFMLVKLVIN